MKITFPIVLAAAALVLTGCETMNVRQEYDPVGYKPTNSNNVRVKVSLQNRMVYVMEGSKPLLIAAVAIGKPDSPTPKGSFSVMEKIQNKRSGSFGFWVNGDSIIAGTSGQCPGGGYHYVGYPMQYWVGFKTAYGFHVGSVWPIPRTHGCIRIHQHAARELFDLVHIGTPVSIAESQPEDTTIGKNQPRPQDYNDPDPPKAYMISPSVFKVHPSDALR